MNSIVLVDKPSGITSFDVIKKLKNTLKEKKIGHSGVLDKMASGLLVCATGKATKLLSIFENSYKVYLAEFTFGLETDTYDITGNVLTTVIPKITKYDLLKVLEEFEGEISQKPPPFSNIKYKGKRLYKYALEGKDVDVAPRSVTIHNIKLISFVDSKAIVEIKCSKGTYVRSLAHDVGERLGCGAVVSSLRRTYVYPFSVDRASSVDSPLIMPLENALYFIESIIVSNDCVRKIKNGISPCMIFNCSRLRDDFYKIVDESGNVLAVIERSGLSYLYKAVLI